MKRVVKILSVVLVLVLSICVVGCNPNPEGDTVNFNVLSSGTIYSRDTQSITLTTKSKDLSFLDTISVADVILEDGLEGKTVETVEMIDSTHVIVTISGRTEYFEGISSIGVLRIDKSKMSNGQEASCYVTVENVFMSVSHIIIDPKAPGNYTIECTYTIPYGEFNSTLKRDDFEILPSPDDKDMVTPVINGKVDHVEVEGKTSFRIRIQEFNPNRGDEFPRVVFPAELTSFGVELVVEVGKGFSFRNDGYILNER